MGFAGFSPAAFAFLRDLAANQTKAWFEANKPIYEQALKKPLGALVGTLAARLETDGVPLNGDPKRSLFRINRDVRFSHDKSPYKTNAGAVWFRQGGGKPGTGVLYFHLAESGCFMAVAFYRPEKEALDAIREAIRVRPDAFQAVTAALAASGLSLGDGNSLVRMPRGFEDLADSAVAPFLKMRNFMVRQELSQLQVGDAALVDTLAVFARGAMPLLQFGWRAVDEVAER